MNAPTITPSRSKDALRELESLLNAGQASTIILASPLEDRLPAPVGAVSLGPDLRVVASATESADRDGLDPIDAVRALLSAHPAPPALIGPDSGGLTRSAEGSCLLLSAFGPAIAPLRTALPPARLALDLGRDLFEALDACLDDFLEAADDAPTPTLLLGLRPRDRALARILAHASDHPTLAFDPDPELVAAWTAAGIPATSCWPAFARAAHLLGDPRLRPGLRPPGAILATSRTLASRLALLSADTLALASSCDEALANGLRSELAREQSLALPLVIAPTPTAGALPPRHLRHLSVAASLLADTLAPQGGVLLVATHTAEDAAHVQMAIIPTLPVPTVHAQGHELAEALEALTLALRPRREHTPESALDARGLARADALLAANLLMRRPCLSGGEAFEVLRAIGAPLAPRRALATTSGQARELARQHGLPTIIGLAVTPPRRAMTTPVPPPPQLCADADAVERAFDALALTTEAELALSPRYLAPTGTADVSTLRLTLARAPIAHPFEVGGVRGRVTAAPPFDLVSEGPIAPPLGALLRALAEGLFHLELLAGARLDLLASTNPEDLTVVDGDLSLDTSLLPMDRRRII